jgi:hypothetical protein
MSTDSLLQATNAPLEYQRPTGRLTTVKKPAFIQLLSGNLNSPIQNQWFSIYSQ